MTSKREIENLIRQMKRAVDYAENGMIKVSVGATAEILDVLTNYCETVDAVPVVHGHWKRRNDTVWKNECSICKMLFYFETPYCCVCGAKMDEKDREQDAAED